MEFLIFKYEYGTIYVIIQETITFQLCGLSLKSTIPFSFVCLKLLQEKWRMGRLFLVATLRPEIKVLRSCVEIGRKTVMK